MAVNLQAEIKLPQSVRAGQGNDSSHITVSTSNAFNRTAVKTGNQFYYLKTTKKQMMQSSETNWCKQRFLTLIETRLFQPHDAHWVIYMMQPGENVLRQVTESLESTL